MLTKQSAFARTPILVALCTYLSGCGTITTLNSGQISTLAESDATARDRLRTSTTAPISLHYAAIKCLYEASTISQVGSGSTELQNWTVEITPFHDKYSLLLKRNGVSASAVIGSDGKLFDFNVNSSIDPSLGAYTPESSSKFDKDAIQKYGSSNLIPIGDPHVVNEISLYFPHIEGALTKPGQEVARVISGDRSTWATYKYRGTTRYNNADVVVLDLDRNMPSIGKENVLVGYDLIDPSDAMPVFLLMKAGTEVRLRRVQCTR